MSENGAAAAPAARQRTVADAFVLEGRGLHGGEEARCEVRPAPPGTGILFRRVDLEGTPTLRADVELVSGVEWETVLRVDGAAVRTAEHLLAALAVHAVDNAEIRLAGAEPPALDGSAAPWCEAVGRVGTEEQEGEARTIEVREPLRIEEGRSRYTITPYDGYRVTAEIDFEHPSIGRQFASAQIAPGSFCRDVAPARTFGLESWAEGLRARGLALGADAQNTVVLSEAGLQPGTELRFPDEFVRHKILDVVGDLVLAGARLRAHVVAERPGHRGNVQVARRLRRLLFRPADGGFVLDAEGLLAFLPHRYPFLLVDRVLEFEGGRRILGLKNVTLNEPFFVGHFPAHPVMPGVLIVEGMAQTGGLLLMHDIDDPSARVVYFMSMTDVKFRRPVRPGDQLLYDVDLVQLRGRTCRLRGVATVAGRVVAEATMTAQVMDR
ncbi:MAG: UDP-3-O-acyl-N-acetylglucosamine deacetylase [Gemmatimonadota bacterium]|nr:UDP-3-O-acyl-N-acetylglucosamine deacetylase [Gemmatimonadota bacterium]